MEAGPTTASSRCSRMRPVTKSPRGAHPSPPQLPFLREPRSTRTSRVRRERKPQTSREPQTQQRKRRQRKPRTRKPQWEAKCFAEGKLGPASPAMMGGKEGRHPKQQLGGEARGSKTALPYSRWCRCSPSSILHMSKQNPTALRPYSGGNSTLRVHQVPRERHKHVASTASPPHPSPQPQGSYCRARKPPGAPVRAEAAMGGSTQRPGRKGGVEDVI